MLGWSVGLISETAPREHSMPKARKSESNEFDRQLGARLKARRLVLGLSQADIGSRLGISFQQIQKYERGTNGLSGGHIAELARVLDVQPSWFYDADVGPAGDDERNRLLLEQQRCFSALPADLQQVAYTLTRE